MSISNQLKTEKSKKSLRTVNNAKSFPFMHTSPSCSAFCSADSENVALLSCSQKKRFRFKLLTHIASPVQHSCKENCLHSTGPSGGGGDRSDHRRAALQSPPTPGQHERRVAARATSGDNASDHGCDHGVGHHSRASRDRADGFPWPNSACAPHKANRKCS